MHRKKIGIVGYGNIGRGVAQAVMAAPDMELTAVFTRRDPAIVEAPVQVLPMERTQGMEDVIDVMVLCGGSATDLPEQGPQLAARFNTVDSYDTHARIPEYFDKMQQAAQAGGKLALISVGWDPGLFSLQRLLGEAILPEGEAYTFWGPGVSQGHSDAVRRVKGVKNAIQYTVPVDSALEAVRGGEQPALTTRQKHTRVCYVAPEEGADLSQIQRDIVTMPNYFSDYDTTVHFVDEQELQREHSGMPHGGFVLRSGKTAAGSPSILEYSLKTQSNPQFTGAVLAACARAVARMAAAGQQGAITLLDVPLGKLAPASPAELRKRLL